MLGQSSVPGSLQAVQVTYKELGSPPVEVAVPLEAWQGHACPDAQQVWDLG